MPNNILKSPKMKLQQSISPTQSDFSSIIIIIIIIIIFKP